MTDNKTKDSTQKIVSEELQNGVILLPVSIGEGFDKLSILQLKSKYIKDAKKLLDVNTELKMLENKLQPFSHKISLYYDELFKCNEMIWKLCDVLREGTSLEGKVSKLSKEEYAKACIDIIEANDDRARIKNLINTALGSLLKEQKSYSSRKLLINTLLNGQLLDKYKDEIIKLSFKYDEVTIVCSQLVTETASKLFHDNIAIKIITTLTTTVTPGAYTEIITLK